MIVEVEQDICHLLKRYAYVWQLIVSGMHLNGNNSMNSNGIGNAIT